MEKTIVRRGLSKNVEGLTELLRRVEALRDVRGEMPLQMVSVFLVIAMKPGILQRDLPEMVKLSQSSVSRNIQALCATDSQGKPGLGLVEQRIGSLGGRTPALHPTRAGKELASRLV
jgi:DNA-binding MarR family transcriptional regulator